MPSEQHLPYKATGDVVVIDGDGSRWVREGEATCPNWAEGIQAPKDADGREIPLGTKALYDLEGAKHKVLGYEFSTRYAGRWMVEIETPSGSAYYVTECFRTTQPDSWEQLEKDAANGPCDYFGFATASCVKCPAYEVRFNGCNGAAALDIVRRAKALAGRGEDE